MTMTKIEAAKTIAKLIEEGDSMSAREFQNLALEALPAFLEGLMSADETMNVANTRLMRERAQLESKVKKAEEQAKDAQDEAEETKMPSGTLAVFGDDSEKLQVIVLRDAPEDLLDKIVDAAKGFLAAGSDGVAPPVSKAASVGGGFLGFDCWASAAVLRVGESGRLQKSAEPKETPADRSFTDWVRSGKGGASPKIDLV